MSFEKKDHIYMIMKVLHKMNDIIDDNWLNQESREIPLVFIFSLNHTDMHII
jgi:hypothetical protein